jgi:plastocyanin
MTTNGFSPSRVVVPPGANITFINDDTVYLAVRTAYRYVHEGFNSGPIPPGSQFQYTFSTYQGTYYYELVSLPNVTGIIVVKP